MKRKHLYGVTIILALAGFSPSELLAQSEQATHVIMVQVGDAFRSVQLHIPAGHDGETPLPLVFNLHGTGGTAERHELLTGMTAIADEEQFLIAGGMAVYEFPDGRLAGNKTWNVNLDPNAASDIDYFSSTIDAVDRKVKVDRNRVYATGFSGGGRMSSRIACELSETFAAVAPVAGVQFLGDCEAARPIPIITIHGTDDPLNVYDRAADPQMNSFWVMGADESVASWARHNGCDSKPKTDAVSEKVNRISYVNCSDGADVVLYVVEGGSHSWPGTPMARSIVERGRPAPNMDIDSSRLIWEFFEAHPLP